MLDEGKRRVRWEGSRILNRWRHWCFSSKFVCSRLDRISAVVAAFSFSELGKDNKDKTVEFSR